MKKAIGFLKGDAAENLIKMVELAREPEVRQGKLKMSEIVEAIYYIDDRQILSSSQRVIDMARNGFITDKLEKKSPLEWVKLMETFLLKEAKIGATSK